MPAASKIFHRYGLDFCCHGGRPLAEVCAQPGLDPEVILAEIATEKAHTGRGTRWDKRPLVELIERIEGYYHLVPARARSLSEGLAAWGGPQNDDVSTAVANEGLSRSRFRAKVITAARCRRSTTTGVSSGTTGRSCCRRACEITCPARTVVRQAALDTARTAARLVGARDVALAALETLEIVDATKRL